jgi:hypothetical protein
MAGMLDTAHDDWSLERAILNGLVKPPSITFLRNELDLRLFEAALPELRREWAALASVSAIN